MSLMIRVRGVEDSQTERRRLNCSAAFQLAKSIRWLPQLNFLYIIFNTTNSRFPDDMLQPLWRAKVPPSNFLSHKTTNISYHF